MEEGELPPEDLTGSDVEQQSGAPEVGSVAEAIGHSAAVRAALGRPPAPDLKRASVLYSCCLPSLLEDNDSDDEDDNDDASQGAGGKEDSAEAAGPLAPPMPEQCGAKRARTFPFELDPFQEAAIGCVHRNESVLVSAHTSAGKTVVAQYAISQVDPELCGLPQGTALHESYPLHTQAIRNNQRVIYTTPIKVAHHFSIFSPLILPGPA
jgi:hypothetical protein